MFATFLLTSAFAGCAVEGHLMLLELDHDHSDLLELDHDHSDLFEFEGTIVHIEGFSDGDEGWPIRPEDLEIKKKILEKLNPPKADIEMQWKDEEKSWVFGLVMLTAQDAKGALALHMLHRHGLGPLLASRADGDKFMKAYKEKALGKTSDIDKAYALVETIEGFPAVAELRSLLLQLSLGALRNFHSYDHTWSVQNGKLQAGLSEAAHDLVATVFTESAATTATTGLNELCQSIIGGTYEHLTKEDYKRFLTPNNAGDRAVTRIGPTESGRQFQAVLAWEDVERTLITIDLTKETAQELKSAEGNNEQYIAMAMPVVGEYLQEKSEKFAVHRQYMQKNRLLIWAAEEAQFMAMYKK